MTDAAKMYRLWVGRELFEFDRSLLKTDPAVRVLVDDLELALKQNRLQFFSLIEKTDHPNDDALAMLNDTLSDLKLLRGPNGSGKTAVTMIDVILSIIPCDPTWDIFTKYGAKWREWDGPKVAVFCNYKMQHHKQHTWKELQKWIPQKELFKYVVKNSKGRLAKTPSWDRDPHVDLACGSQIYFKAYEQDQDSFESFAADIFHWSEQGHEAKFNGADERVRRRSGRHVFDLTPHKVEGRPDTGAGSWIWKIDKGENEMGHIVGRYHMSIEDVPPWVLTKEMKEAAYEKHVAGPQRRGDIKALREGRARYYGEWHTTAGLVYDEWDRNKHVIDDDLDLLKNVTRYRGGDHGTTNPKGCLCLAVDQHYNHFIYREHHRPGSISIKEFVDEIVNGAGNRLQPLGLFEDPRTGIEFKRFEEVQDSETFVKSVLDSRSFSSKEMGREIGWLYRAYGLRVSPASGAFSDQFVPAVKEYLRIDPERKHVVTGELGAPRLYVFRSCINFIREIESYVWDEYASGGDLKNMKETPRKKDDHLMSCISYLLQIPPRFMGTRENVERHGTKRGEAREPVSMYTGY